MGWAWSLDFAQAINTSQTARALSHIQPQLLSDRGPPLVFRPGRSETTVWSYVYVDNLGVLSNNVPLVSREIQDVATHFDSLGLSIHEREVNDVFGVALGVAVHVADF